jgi:hypothetical protein
MKKALIVLLLLALVAGGLFAQFSIGGYVRSGLMVAVEDDTTLHVYNPDPGNRVRAELNPTYTNADGTAGARSRFRLNTNVAGESSLSFEWGWAWFEPIDNVLRISLGRTDDYFLGTGGAFDENNGTGAGTGLFLRLDPMAGLVLGAGVQPAPGEFGDASYRFGVKYTASGLFAAAANLNYTGSTGLTNAAAGVDILALSGTGFTKLAVDAVIQGLGDTFDTAGQVGVGPRVDFKFGDLSGRVRARLWIPGVGKVDDLDLGAELYGQYPITSAMTFKTGVGYALKGALADTNGSQFGYREWDDLDRNPTTEDSSVLVVRPYLTFNVGGAGIDAGYSLLTNVGGASKTKHAVFMTLNVGF